MERYIDNMDYLAEAIATLAVYLVEAAKHAELTLAEAQAAEAQAAEAAEMERMFADPCFA